MTADATISDARQRFREIGKTERAKAAVRELERKESPRDDGKPKKHAECTVPPYRQWFALTEACGHKFHAFFPRGAYESDVRPWAWHNGHDIVAIVPLDAAP